LFLPASWVSYLSNFLPKHLYSTAPIISFFKSKSVTDTSLPIKFPINVHPSSPIFIVLGTRLVFTCIRLVDLYRFRMEATVLTDTSNSAAMQHVPFPSLYFLQIRGLSFEDILLYFLFIFKSKIIDLKYDLITKFNVMHLKFIN